MGSFLSAIFGTKPNLGNIKNPLAKGSAFSQLSEIYPNLSQTTGAAEGNILSELQGQLPADVLQNIQNYGADWGITSGMPGSGAAGDVTLADLGLTSLQEEQQGLQNYLNFSPTLQGQFTLNPEQTGQVDVANAAPLPAAAGLGSFFSQIGGSIFGAGGKGGGGGGGIGALAGLL